MTKFLVCNKLSYFLMINGLLLQFYLEFYLIKYINSVNVTIFCIRWTNFCL